MTPRLLPLALALLAGPALAQDPPAAASASPDARSGWQQCEQLSDDAQARLACFDRWVQGQSPAAWLPPPEPMPPPPDCRSGPQTPMSRYWELEAGSDCGRFNIRGYKPISLAWVHGNRVNVAPGSPTEGRTVTSEQPYMRNEMRLQLSVRTKIGTGFISTGDPDARDSLWFGYTQQSYWQLFNKELSRPFRTTDHEPELFYILPTPADLPGGWRLRYTGLSINHQSNGQTLPLSRSWNRLIFLAGFEKDERYMLTGRIWNRMSDGDGDGDINSLDDNPDIEDYIGRAELTGSWQLDADHSLALTLRHSLRSEAKGSWRLEWLQALGDRMRDANASGLRLHVQLFNGYGDSLLDYNFRRTTFSVGLSLVDF